MSDSFYPITNYLSTMSEPEGSKDRNAIFFAGHIGFLLFNIINVGYIIFFDGIALRRLKDNLLTKITLVACVFQICSCSTSIRRYNNNDEFGIDGKIGVATGLVAYFFGNIVYMHVCFPKTYKKVLPFGVIFLTVLSIAIMKLMLRNWDDEPRPFFFKHYVAGSSVFHVISNFSCMRAHQKGEISIDENILRKDQLNRVFGVCMFLELVSVVLSHLLKSPIEVYPDTGATYSLMVIIAGYVGRMDFMKEEERKVGSLPTENIPLV